MTKHHSSAADSPEDFFDNETFVAFFDLHQPASSGVGLTGLCKVARSSDQPGTVQYINLTFIFDTPDPKAHLLAEAAVKKLNTESFQRYLPEIKSVSSVPCTRRDRDSHIHQIDLVFGKDPLPELRDALNHIVFVVRQSGGFKTEAPQWWDESSAPKPSKDEQANWGIRLRALTRFLKSS